MITALSFWFSLAHAVEPTRRGVLGGMAAAVVVGRHVPQLPGNAAPAIVDEALITAARASQWRAWPLFIEIQLRDLPRDREPREGSFEESLTRAEVEVASRQGVTSAEVRALVDEALHVAVPLRRISASELAILRDVEMTFGKFSPSLAEFMIGRPFHHESGFPRLPRSFYSVDDIPDAWSFDRLTDEPVSRWRRRVWAQRSKFTRAFADHVYPTIAHVSRQDVDRIAEADEFRNIAADLIEHLVAAEVRVRAALDLTADETYEGVRYLLDPTCLQPRRFAAHPEFNARLIADVETFYPSLATHMREDLVQAEPYVPTDLPIDTGLRSPSPAIDVLLHIKRLNSLPLLSRVPSRVAPEGPATEAEIPLLTKQVSCELELGEGLAPAIVLSDDAEEI